VPGAGVGEAGLVAGVSMYGEGVWGACMCDIGTVVVGFMGMRRSDGSRTLPMTCDMVCCEANGRVPGAV
jgi:hypothetical protein